MALVRCEVSEGLRSSEATVAVRDYTGRPEYLPVDRGLLVGGNGKSLLPVRVISQDRNAVLVELPDETDSGAHRIWVRAADLVPPETVP
jgi:hypothetical protein